MNISPNVCLSPSHKVLLSLALAINAGSNRTGQTTRGTPELHSFPFPYYYLLHIMILLHT